MKICSTGTRSSVSTTAVSHVHLNLGCPHSTSNTLLTSLLLPSESSKCTLGCAATAVPFRDSVWVRSLLEANQLTKPATSNTVCHVSQRYWTNHQNTANLSRCPQPVAHAKMVKNSWMLLNDNVVVPVRYFETPSMFTRFTSTVTCILNGNTAFVPHGLSSNTIA